MRHSSYLKSLFFIITMLLVGCGGGGGENTPVEDVSKEIPVDAQYDSVVINQQIDVELEQMIVSNTITITGINTDINISVSDGEYSIDNNAFTTVSGSVYNGQTVTLRLQSSSSAFTKSSMNLTLGDKSYDFSVQTLHDETPEQFSFSEKLDTPLSVWVYSDIVTIKDITKPIPIAISNGTYSIDGQPFTSEPGVIRTNQQLQIRIKSATTKLSENTASLTLSNQNHTFKVITQGGYASITSNRTAYAAIREDHTVVTWGGNNDGGDSSEVAESLVNIKEIVAHRHGGTFAALTYDGKVVTWGSSASGGNDSSAVQAQLTNVVSITASTQSYAALKVDGSVISWGRLGNTEIYGKGFSSALQSELTNVKEVVASFSAFAALKSDGSVVTWGEDDSGGNSSAVAEKLVNVRMIKPTDGGFLAITETNDVIYWGLGMTKPELQVPEGLANVKDVVISDDIYPTFAAITEDNKVVTWGSPSNGGDSSSVTELLTNVVSVVASKYSFAALKSDGSVITWGSALFGGDSSAITEQLLDVVEIVAGDYAFAALKADRTVVSWGRATETKNWGGDANAVAGELNDIVGLKAYEDTFVAVKSNGQIISWGHRDGIATLASDKVIRTINITDNNFSMIDGEGQLILGGKQFNGVNGTGISNVIKFVQYHNQNTIALTAQGRLFALDGESLPEHIAELTNVKDIFSHSSLFIAVLTTGENIVWSFNERPYYDLESNYFSNNTNLENVLSNGRTILALTADGFINTFGYADSGGDISSFWSELYDIESIYRHSYSFTALRSDGLALTWGESGSVVFIENVKSITNGGRAMAALLEDGTVVTWGDQISGGDTSRVADKLTNVTSIMGTLYGFKALKEDGSVVSWGGRTDFDLVNDEIMARALEIETLHFLSSDISLALLANGNVEIWSGADASIIQNLSVDTNVQLLVINQNTVLTLNDKHQAKIWGKVLGSENEFELLREYNDISKVSWINYRLALEKLDGTMSTWGNIDSIEPIKLNLN